MTNTPSNLRRKKGYYDPISNIGWRDAMVGHSFPLEYDSWDDKSQRNYENGRLRAVNFSYATGKQPQKQVINSIYSKAVAAIGPAVPKSR